MTLSCRLRTIIDTAIFYNMHILFYIFLLILIFYKKIHWSLLLLFLILSFVLHFYAFMCSTSPTLGIRVVENLCFVFLVITIIVIIVNVAINKFQIGQSMN